MFRATVRILISTTLLAALAGGGVVGYRAYEDHQSVARQIEQLERDKAKLAEEKQLLQTAVERLSAEKRVAEVLVTDQSQVEGKLKTTLLFVEYARDGSALPAKTFTINGNAAHIDAMVIKFDRGLVAADDALRGHSVALFHRLFGEDQPPEQGFSIDVPGAIPDVYRGAKQPAEQQKFERNLWQNFWRLADDKAYRAEMGVRVANGQGIWGPFAADRLYTITLDADGGLNMASEPLKGIYREAMKQRMTKAE
jgi:hypothetical protein